MRFSPPAKRRRPGYESRAFIVSRPRCGCAASGGLLLAEPELAAFAAHPVVARWRTSWQVDLDHPAGVALFLASHGDWWAEDGVPRTLRLEPDGAALLRRPGADDRMSGTWALDGAEILLRMPDGEVSLKIRRAPYYLVLEGPDGAWAIDPVTCG